MGRGAQLLVVAGAHTSSMELCLPFTPTLFTPTGITSTFTLSEIHHILRTDGLMALKFWFEMDMHVSLSYPGSVVNRIDKNSFFYRII